MALLWASWHVPAFYTPGMPHRFMPMWPMLTLIAGCRLTDRFRKMLRDKERAFRYPCVDELEWLETGGPGILE
jgi:hypothetical protein